jgi:hypothetical protein
VALLQCFQRQARLGIRWADANQARLVAEVEDALPAEPVGLAKVLRMFTDVFRYVPRDYLVHVVTALGTGKFWVRIAASGCVTAQAAGDVKELARKVFPKGRWPAEIARKLVIERNSPLASFFSDVVRTIQ